MGGLVILVSCQRDLFHRIFIIFIRVMKRWKLTAGERIAARMHRMSFKFSNFISVVGIARFLRPCVCTVGVIENFRTGIRSMWKFRHTFSPSLRIHAPESQSPREIKSNSISHLVIFVFFFFTFFLFFEYRNSRGRNIYLLCVFIFNWRKSLKINRIISI